MVNKNSSLVDFVRFDPCTYARTQQFLPPLRSKIDSLDSEAVACRCSRKVFLKVSLNLLQCFLKETTTQVFPYEFGDIFKNTTFHRTLPVAASFDCLKYCFHCKIYQIMVIRYLFYSFFV